MNRRADCVNMYSLCRGKPSILPSYHIILCEHIWLCECLNNKQAEMKVWIFGDFVFGVH